LFSDLQAQLPPMPTEEEAVSTFSSDIIEEALNFQGTTVVGSCFENICSDNAASYFSGYIALKLNRFHKKVCGQASYQCQECSPIFVAPDLGVHLFVSFKDYQQNVQTN